MATQKQIEKNGMTVINEHIKNNSFANIYLLYGDEKYLINQYRDKLVNAVIDVNDTMNFSRYIGEKPDTAAIIELCETMPFIAERRVILVENSGLFKTSCEAFAEKLSNILDSSVLIFIETEIDKRNKLYKTVDKDGCALCFNTPDDRTLAVWIKSQLKETGKTIEDTAVFKIIESTSSDMMLIKNEIEKLICYAYDKSVVTLSDVDAVCATGVESKIFEMVDAIVRKDKKKAIHLYNDLLQNKEPAMRILYLITRQFDIMLKLKLCLSEGKNETQAASVIGAPVWSVKKYVSECRNYPYENIKAIVDYCQETDYKIKTGQTVDVVAVEMLITSLCIGKCGS